MFDGTIAVSLRERIPSPGNAFLLYGPRQAGKTTLVRHLLSDQPQAVSFTGDDLYTQTLLDRHELEHLKRIVGAAPLVFIDEAQRIENIGLTIKLLVDHLPVTVIASGSASFDLANRLSEPLTGRTRTFHLHPLSWEEVSPRYRLAGPESTLEEMLRFGMYPRDSSRAMSASGPRRPEPQRPRTGPKPTRTRATSWQIGKTGESFSSSGKGRGRRPAAPRALLRRGSIAGNVEWHSEGASRWPSVGGVRGGVQSTVPRRFDEGTHRTRRHEKPFTQVDVMFSAFGPSTPSPRRRPGSSQNKCQ